ncbi:MAG: CinA family nicotinamide mononucleotide deamidase-related protein [Sumerlaeia bacterium]
MQTAPKSFILSTGSEITEGLYADTNARDLSQILKDNGFLTVGHRAMRDEPEEIKEAIRSATRSADLLISTGGIGPTQDDLNREIIASVYQRPLRRIHQAEVLLRQRFKRRQRTLPHENLKQTDVPEGAEPLLNFWGTATGFFIPPAQGLAGILVLPGVPREWTAMMERYFPRIIQRYYPNRPCFYTDTIHTVMLAESEINSRLKPLFTSSPDVTLALLAKRGHVRIRIMAEAATKEQAKQRSIEVRDEILPLLPQEVVLSVGEENLTIEEKLVELFRTQGKTLALAESCTGGGIAKRITDVAGSSAVLGLCCVTYSNAMKTAMLGVSEEILATHGAVSEDCVKAMCAGVLQISGADVALAVSGIAGPDGGSPEKPVGTVWFALGTQGKQPKTFEIHYPGDRLEVRSWAENQGLDLLRKTLTGN